MIETWDTRAFMLVVAVFPIDSCEVADSSETIGEANGILM
jgi:hypothetical protein